MRGNNVTDLKIRLDRRPLYLRAEEALAEMIAHCDTGAQLPAEPELAKSLGISRTTLREAIRSFEKRGLIERKPGVGTFVLAPHPIIDNGLEELESIETLAARLGLETRVTGLEVDERPATAHEADVLQIDPGALTVRITRNILTGREPIAFLRDVLPAGVLDREDFAEFHGSVLDTLLQRDEPELSHSRTDLTAEAADSWLARRLGLQPGMPILLLKAVLFARDGVPVDYSHSYFVPGYFKFHVVRMVGRVGA